MTDGGQPLRVESAKKIVADAIRDLISNGTLKSGERVSIEALAARFGVSRTPVRDALGQLSGEGLVQIEPRVGVTIRKIEREEILDVYRIEEALGPLIASCAAERGSDIHRLELRQLSAKMQQAAADQDVATYSKLVSGCRQLLLDMAGSDPLRVMMAALDGRVQQWRYHNLRQPGRIETSAADYEKICDAVARGDSAAAHELMHVHMMNAAVRARQTIDFEEQRTGGGFPVGDPDSELAS